MLVLTRKPQEQIRIGNGVTITILRVKGNSVRIGIEAPPEVRVVRGELPAFDAATAGETSIESPAAEESSGDEAGEAPLIPPRRRPAAVKPSVALSGAW
ncbi:MAG: carbon storage regulator [Planctomycetes bacterium]|nr:carbon storage regulator [Planctomycetota bacterium]